MPVDVLNDTQQVVSVTGETMQLYYYNVSNVLTSDAGEEAGVLVVGKLANAPLLDDIGSKVGNFRNTSLAFSCLALTNEVPFNYVRLEQSLETTGATLLATMCAGFANGDYTIDYRKGLIYAKKATTASTATSVSYKRPSKPAASVTIDPGDVQIGAVEIKNATTEDRAVVSTAGGDGVLNTQNQLEVGARNSAFNGSTWDRVRSGIKIVTTALTGFLNTIPFGVYNATRPVLTDAQGAPFQLDTEGKQIVLPYTQPTDMVSGAIVAAMTGTTSTSLVPAPGAGLRNYITTIIISNAHATVGTDVIIQDGSGGTTLMTIPAAAVYGGASITLPTPLRQPTANTALFVANVTTGASTKASAVGYKGV